jgi:predicted lipoprotein with Yx(FWY)xxD motif
MDLTDTPAAIRAFIDAMNAGDSDAFAAAFTPDATLDDWGRGYAGHAGVRDWDHTDNIGMSGNIKPIHRLLGRRLLFGGLALGAAATIAACSSSPSSNVSGPPGSPSAGASSSVSVTISAKNVAGVGTVLVDGQGRTLYLLTSEKGGKITCTASNGCTQAWPETLLGNGMPSAKAGSGVQPSMLGTVKDASGNLEVTYDHWPLYTFSGDSGPGVAKGQGLMSFGDTWYALNTSGNPVTTKSADSSSSGGSSSGGGNGY